MKNLLILVLCLFSMGAIAQKKGLPQQVNDSLIFRYPDASDIKFRKQKDDFRIKFDNKGSKISSVYDANGNWKESVTTIEDENIPENVSKSINKKYPGGSITGLSLLEDNSGKQVYQAKVNTEKFYYNLELDSSGKILKTEQVKKEAPPSYDSSESKDDGGE